MSYYIFKTEHENCEGYAVLKTKNPEQLPKSFGSFVFLGDAETSGIGFDRARANSEIRLVGFYAWFVTKERTAA